MAIDPLDQLHQAEQICSDLILRAKAAPAPVRQAPKKKLRASKPRVDVWTTTASGETMLLASCSP
jgi:hypothetical protein